MKMSSTYQDLTTVDTLSVKTFFVTNKSTFVRSKIIPILKGLKNDF